MRVNIRNYLNAADHHHRARMGDGLLDHGYKVFDAASERRVKRGRVSRVYSAADDKFILEFYGPMSAQQVADHLATKERPLTRNMIIGRYNRIKHRKDTQAPAPIKTPTIEELPKRIERAVSCKTPGCSNIPIKYSTHGLCPQCNARRLDEMPRRNRSREVTAAVGW